MLARFFGRSGAGAPATFKPLRNFSRRQRKGGVVSVTNCQWFPSLLLDGGSGSGNASSDSVSVVDVGEALLEESYRLFDAVSCVFGLCLEECSSHASCIHGCGAGPKFEFLWAVSDGAAPKAIPAVTYFTNVFRDAEKTLDTLAACEKLPPGPELIVALSTSWRRLLRVFSHVYAVHWASIEAVGAGAAVHEALIHSVSVIRGFKEALVAEAELEPLAQALQDPRMATAGGRA